MQPDECFGPGASVLCTDHDILYFVHKKRHHAGPARAKTVTGRPDRLGPPAKGSPCNPLSAGCVSGLPIFLPSLSTLVAVTTFSGPSGPSGPFIHINLYERVFCFYVESWSRRSTTVRTFAGFPLTDWEAGVWTFGLRRSGPWTFEASKGPGLRAYSARSPIPYQVIVPLLSLSKPRSPICPPNLRWEIAFSPASAHQSLYAL